MRIRLNLIVAFNIILVAGCIVTLGYWVNGANAAAASEYRISSLRKEVAGLMERRTTLTSQKSATEDLAAAGAFAVARGMVEAKDASYVFESGNVALKSNK